MDRSLGTGTSVRSPTSPSPSSSTGARALGLAPRYVDYLMLGITTSTAFSPTDVMPLTAWAKLTMAIQSLLSLTVVGLVIARAVNAFT